MYKPAIFLLTLVLCACSPRNANMSSNGGSKDAKVSSSGQQMPAATADMLFPIHVEGRWGYVDRSGKLVLKADYAAASRFSEGLAAVQPKKGGKAGYIDATGKPVIPLVFDLADPFSEGLAAVMQNGKWGFIDKTGKVVIPLIYGSAGRFSEGAAVVGLISGMSVSSFTYINPKGGFLLSGRDNKPLVFEEAGMFHEGWAPVRNLGEPYHYIDMSGKTVLSLPPQTRTALDFGGGLAPVEIQLQNAVRWGFIVKEKDFKLAIPAQYLRAGAFTEGVAVVQASDGKFGYIDPKGTMVIPPKFDAAAQFYNGLAQVAVGQTIGYIDHSGNYVWGPK